MKRIAIDMDDTIADATSKFLKLYEQDFGKKLERKILNGLMWNEFFSKEEFDRIADYPNQKGFFRDLSVLADAQDVIKKLSEQYEVYIVSSATEFPLSLTEKLGWLEEHFPFITPKNIVFCGVKGIIRADLLIDDHPRNLKAFVGEKLLFTAPNNFGETEFQRVNSWKEVEHLLLKHDD